MSKNPPAHWRKLWTIIDYNLKASIVSLNKLTTVQSLILVASSYFRSMPAHDYNPNVGLLMVGGELCGTGSKGCGIGTQKTLLSSDSGETFDENADIPEEVEAACGVFLNDTAFMVIGGRDVSDSPSKNATWIYDVTGDSWSPGPEMTTARSKHVCKLITDCDGSDKVVVVGGDGEMGGMNSTEIYDINSGSWSAGNIEYPPNCMSELAEIGCRKRQLSISVCFGFRPKLLSSESALSVSAESLSVDHYQKTSV